MLTHILMIRFHHIFYLWRIRCVTIFTLINFWFLFFTFFFLQIQLLILQLKLSLKVIDCILLCISIDLAKVSGDCICKHLFCFWTSKYFLLFLLSWSTWFCQFIFTNLVKRKTRFNVLKFIKVFHSNVYIIFNFFGFNKI